MRPKVATKLDNIVEVDEVYIGGWVSNMNKTKRTKRREAGKSYDSLNYSTQKNKLKN